MPIALLTATYAELEEIDSVAVSIHLLFLKNWYWTNFNTAVIGKHSHKERKDQIDEKQLILSKDKQVLNEYVQIKWLRLRVLWVLIPVPTFTAWKLLEIWQNQCMQISNLGHSYKNRTSFAKIKTYFPNKLSNQIYDLCLSYKHKIEFFESQFL